MSSLSAAAGDGHEPEQGIYILGKVADTRTSGSRYFSVLPRGMDLVHLGAMPAVTPAASGANLTVTYAGVRHTGADPWFEGMVLAGAGGEIKLAPGARSNGTTTRYHVQFRATGNTGWSEYCGDPAVPGDPPILAVALRGWYDMARWHHDDDTITFACDDGAARKCTLWGYVAGTAGPGDHAWDRHQACTRMANDDNCGTGEPHTRELTPIVIRDYDGAPNLLPTDAPALSSPVPFPGNPDVYWFEAGWSPRGAVCLSKARWALLPPDPCPLVLPDPRTREGIAAKGHFCDDLPISDLWKPVHGGALLANGSKMMDAPLYRWTNATSTDQVMTIQGFYDTPWSGPPATAPLIPPVAPFPGTKCSGTPCAYNTFNGVDAIVLRNLPGTLDAAVDMTPLFLWTRTAAGRTDHVLSLQTAQPGPGFTLGGFEAYVFQRPDRVPGLRELRLCQNPSGYFTTIGSCATPVVSLGYAQLPP